MYPSLIGRRGNSPRPNRPFRPLSILILSVGWLSLSHGQWSANPDVNTPITTEQYHQTYPVAASDGSGGAIITWRDFRNGTDFDIFAQRVDANGNLEWASGGIPVCQAADDQTRPRIIGDDNGGAIIVWQDRRSGTNWDIYVQRIDAAGNPLWQSGGVNVTDAAGDQIYPVLTDDGQQGAIISWDDGRPGIGWFDIYAQRVNAAGVIQWADDGLAVFTDEGLAQRFPKIVHDASGGAIIVWHGYHNGGNSLGVRGQRVDGNGNRLWSDEGVVVSDLDDYQMTPAIAGDGSGGVLAAWLDRRNGMEDDIYAQRLDATGTPSWALHGVPVTTSGGFQGEHTIISDGTGGLIITYLDDFQDWFAQRLDATGTAVWDVDGKLLAPYSGLRATLVSDGQDGALVSWPGDQEIKGQRIAGDGTFSWNFAGTIIHWGSPAGYPAMVEDGGGGAIVAWHENRIDDPDTWYDIYAQRVYENGTLNPSPHTNTSWQAVFPFPSGNSLYGIHYRTPDTVVAVGGGGLMLRSTDGGERWKQVYRPGNTFATFRGIDFAGDELTGVVVGSGGTIIRTTSGGDDWTSVESNTSADLLGVAFAGDDRVVAVGYGGVIMRSSDAGRTWSSIASPTSRNLNAVDFGDSDSGIIVGDTALVLRSTDGGTTWSSNQIGLADLKDVFFRGRDTAYIAGDPGGRYWTPNGGRLWWGIIPIDTGSGDPDSAFSPIPKHFTTITSLSHDTIIIGSNIHMWTTYNFGSWWETDTFSREAPVYDIAFSSPTTGMAVGSYGMILKTTNAGADWTEKSVKKTGSFQDIDFTDGNTAWVVGANGRVAYTQHAGREWQEVTNLPYWSGTSPWWGGYHAFTAVDFLNFDTGWIAGNLGKIIRTYDHGLSWSDHNTGSAENNALHFFNKDTGVVIGAGGTYPHVTPGAYRTTNGGASWAELENIVGTSRGYLYNLFFLDGENGWAVGDTGIWPNFRPLLLHTSDNGQTWSDVTGPIHTLLGGSDAVLQGVSFQNENDGIVTGLRGTFPTVEPLIIKTTDGGTTWTLVDHPLEGSTGYLEDVFFLDGNRGYAVGGSGFQLYQTHAFIPNELGTGYILATNDGGDTWAAQVPPSSYLRRIHFSQTPGSAYIGGAVGAGMVCAITLPDQNVKTWLGGSSNWFEPSNWSPSGIPLKYENVVIPALTPSNPVIPGPADQVTVGSIVIGSTLTVDPTVAHFVVKGDLVEYGTLVADDDQNIIVGGSNLQQPGGPFNAPGTRNTGATPGTAGAAAPGRYLFNGKGEVTGSYQHLTVDASSELRSAGDITVTQSLKLLADLTLRDADRLVVEHSDASAFTGSGTIRSGSVERAISAVPQDRPYRFANDRTFVLPMYTSGSDSRLGASGAIPARLRLLTRSWEEPRAFSLKWKSHTGSAGIPTENRVSSLGAVDFRNTKWAIGRPIATGIPPGSATTTKPGVPQYGDPRVRRLYQSHQEGGGIFDAEISFGYEEDEIMDGTDEDSLVLLTGPFVSAQIAPKWNLLSMPVRPVDSTKIQVFTTAASAAFEFDPIDGYLPATQLRTGVGYWMKYTTAEEIEIGGIDMEDAIIPLIEGWNLIGGLSYGVDVAGLSTYPPGILTSSFYEYAAASALSSATTAGAAGYAVAESLEPMRGYWIKANADGQLYLNANAAPSLEKKIDPMTQLDRLHTLEITDAEGLQKTLYFGPADGIVPRLYELPPVPPGDAFDVRFGSHRSVGLTENGSGRTEGIRVQGCTYPLTVTWNLGASENPGYVLRVGEREITLASRGSTVLPRPESISLTLPPSGEVDRVPLNYALDQNYPNPFNPSTTIRYALPAPSHVTLTVYNVLGQVVSVPVDEVQQAGVRSISWDGGIFSSGVYFIRIEATGTNNSPVHFTSSRKMLLVK